MLSKKVGKTTIISTWGEAIRYQLNLANRFDKEVWTQLVMDMRIMLLKIWQNSLEKIFAFAYSSFQRSKYYQVVSLPHL